MLVCCDLGGSCALRDPGRQRPVKVGSSVDLVNVGSVGFGVVGGGVVPLPPPVLPSRFLDG